MKRTILIAITVMALVFGLVAYASGLDDKKTVTVTANVPNVFSLTLSNPASVGFTVIDPDADTSGSNLITVILKSNKKVNLTYTMTDFAGGPTNTPTIPMDKMSFKFSTSTTATALPAGTLNGSVDRGNNSYDTSFSFKPGLEYEEGTYTGSMIYTATQL
ncbi:MAG: hypothetical protein LLG08_02125 [Actinomycetia bacterium]|nr:hypothetical protein [Actinomycetes bacterium]